MAEANVTVSNDHEGLGDLSALENDSCTYRETLELLLRENPASVLERFKSEEIPRIRRMTVMTICRLLEASAGERYGASVVEAWSSKSDELYELAKTDGERNLILVADALMHAFVKPWH